MAAGQRVNCVPGLEQLTDKYNLIVTLRFYFGEGAFTISPPSYLLPEEYWKWRLRIARQVPCLPPTMIRAFSSAGFFWITQRPSGLPVPRGLPERATPRGLHARHSGAS